MKDRNISTLDFLNALQRELICLEIRSKIYISRNDKEYFARLIEKKRRTIDSLSQKNDLSNILDDENLYLKFWHEIVPKFGFPNLIYNIVGVTEEQLKFPYRGTVVKAGGEYGVTNRVNFENKTVEVIFRGVSAPTSYFRDEVVRVSHQETDEFFYYYPNNSFKTKNCGIGTLVDYNMTTKVAKINFESGDFIDLPQNEIARVL